MHDLVVRQRQHEVLAERVQHAERQVGVVELAVHRLPLEVIERVVHPAHVPLHAKAEAPDVGRTRDEGPRRRFLGDRLSVWLLFENLDVESPQEIDRLQVLPAAELVRDPLALLARVIEIEHRGDRVHPEPVGVIAVEPAERAAQQKAADLVASIVEDRAAPVRVHSESRVGVLEEVRPIEVLQPELVRRKVRRHPVQHDADTVLVQVVDQKHEVLRRAVAAGWCEVPGDLVAPRLVERVLHHGHELDVRESHPAYVVREPRGQLAVCQPAVALLGHSHPRSEVHLVNRPRSFSVVRVAAVLHPVVIAPLVGQVPNDRGLARRRLRVGGERVGLVHAVACHPRMHVVLVEGAVPDGRNEAFPDARLLARIKTVRVLVPPIEFADHAHRVGVGRPGGEVGALGVM